MPTDTELIASSLTGEKEAFASIVQRYQGMVSGVTYCVCGDLMRSEDLAQETFIAAWKGLPQLRDPAQLPAWLRGIARRTALNARRQEARRPIAIPFEEETHHPAAVEDPPIQRLIDREEQQVLWRALEDIPEPYRETMVLYYRQQQSAAAAAAALEVTEETVRQRLARGRTMLREQVAAMVEQTLKASRPSAAFTIAVLAALPAAAPTTALAAIGAAAAKGSSAAKGLGMAGFLVMLIGPVIAVFVGIQGTINNLRQARSPREKLFIKRWSAVFAGLIIGSMVINAAVIFTVVELGRRGFAPFDSRNTFGAVQVVFWGVYFVAVVAMVCHCRRRQRQIQIEDGTYRGEAQLGATSTPRQWVRGLALGVVVGLSWMVGMAALAEDWLSVAIGVGVGLIAWGACATWVLRGGLRRVRSAMMLMWACVMALTAVMFNVRFPAWFAAVNQMSVETVQQQIPALWTNLLLAVIGIGVAAMFWITLAPLAKADSESPVTQ